MPSLLARERRAQIETPIIFIFAIVAGVLVLLVVGWFVLQQQDTATTTRTLNHLRGVASAIQSAGSATGTNKTVPLIDELRVECDETGLALWYGRNERVQLPGSMLFSEPSVRTVAHLRSAPLGGAYRVGNVVFLTRTGTNLELDSVIDIIPSATTPGAGTLEFIDGTAPYFSPALLEGARIAESREGYVCGLGETLRRYKFVNYVQRERMALLVQEYNRINSPCQYLYDDAPFAAIDHALSDGDGNTLSGNAFTLTNAEAIARAEGQIRALNDNLVRASCATVS